MHIFQVSKKILKNLSALLLGLLGLFGASLLLLGLRLQQGPLSLDGLTPYLEKNLNNFASSFTIHLYGSQLIWERMTEPFKIRFDRVIVQHQQFTAHKIEAGALQVSFDLKDLMMLNFQPSGVEIQTPHLYLENLDVFSSQSQVQKGSQEDFIFDLFQGIVQQDSSSVSHSKHLKCLKISQGSITLNDPYGWGAWQLPQVDIDVIKKSHKFLLKVKAVVNQQIYEGSIEQSDRDHQTKFSLDLPKASLSLLHHLHLPLRQKLSSSLQEILTILDKNSLDFSLRIQGVHQKGEGLKEGLLNLRILPGTINLSEIFPSPIPLQTALIEARLKDNVWHLDQGHFALDNCLLTLKGSGNWDFNTSRTSFKFNSKIENVSQDTLSRLWPFFAAPIPRQWILQNIKTVHVKEAICDVSGHVSYGKESLETVLENISGNILFENAKLQYLDTLPMIENIKGHARFDKESFVIDLDQGRSEGISLQSTRVIIHDLHLKDQTLELTSFLQSSIENVLKYSNKPPLFIAERYDLNSLNCTGQAEIRLDLRFPLEMKIDPNQIHVNLAANLRDVSLKKSVGIGDVHLSKGDLKLVVKDGQVDLEGDCLLNDTTARLQWQNISNSAIPLSQTKWRIETVLTSETFSKFGLDATPYLKGSAPTVLTYLEDNSTHAGQLDISCNLKPLGINAPLAVKPLHQTGFLQALLLLQNQKLTEIKKFQLVSMPSFQVQGQAIFQADGKALKEVNLHQVNLGLTKFKGKITKSLHQPYHIHLDGKVFDIHHLKQQFENSGEAQFPIVDEGINFFAHFKELQIDPQLRLFDNTLIFNYKKESFSTLKFKAYLKNLKRPKDLVYGVIESQTPLRRRFTLQTESAGLLVRSLGIPIKMYGGKFQLYAFNDTSAKHPLSWYGKMRILDFTVRDVPMLGQILSLAFPTGMADLFSEKGLPFGRFSTKFTLTPHRILLEKGLARGNSLGITLQGLLGRTSKEIHLTGSVIPAYVLNSLIAKIPLVGEILAGGKNEGLFSASYHIDGSQDNPKISINPASFLTPGFLRGIFEGSDNSQEEEEDD